MDVDDGRISSLSMDLVVKEEVGKLDSEISEEQVRDVGLGIEPIVVLVEEPGVVALANDLNAEEAIILVDDDANVTPNEDVPGVPRIEIATVNNSTANCPATAVAEKDIHEKTTDVVPSGSDIEVVRNETMQLVERELSSARTALVGYAAEADMLESNLNINLGQEQLTLFAVSKRLDDILETGKEYEKEHKQDRQSALSLMAALVRELRSLANMCTNGLVQASIERMMQGLLKEQGVIEGESHRLGGAMRRADQLRVHKEVGMDVARSLITEIKNLVRQRRMLSDEIQAVSASIERERRRVPDLDALRAEFQGKLVEFEKRMRLEQRRLQDTLDEVEAGPSRAVIPHVRVSRHVRQRETMNREQRAAKRAKVRASVPKSATPDFKFFGKGAVTRFAPSKIVGWMESMGVQPARRFHTIIPYIKVSRRLVLRDVNATVERNGRNVVIGRAILNSIERFWLCIMRWQYLQTRKTGEGVR